MFESPIRSAAVRLDIRPNRMLPDVVRKLMTAQSMASFMAICDAEYEYYLVKSLTWQEQALVCNAFMKLIANTPNYKFDTSSNTHKFVFRTEIIENPLPSDVVATKSCRR